MKAEDLLYERRSIREYQDREVEKDRLKNIVERARFAPTGHNIQPWKMVAVREDDKLQKLAELKGQNPSFPACIVVFVREEGLYVRDASALTTYLTLAAAVEGLDSCWVNVYDKDYEDEIKEMLNAPSEYRLFSYVTVGYGAEDPSPEKKDREEILHWEEF